jgi:membrane-bound ClpP family serine protease
MRKTINTDSIKSMLKDWAKVLLLLLDEAAVLVILILALRFFGIQIPLPITITITVLLGIFVFIVHVAVIPSFHKKKVAGREGMIGAKGTVVAPLTPVGTIMIMGEYWKAESLDGDIGVDENVEVVGLEGGLRLKVRRGGR